MILHKIRKKTIADSWGLKINIFAYYIFKKVFLKYLIINLFVLSLNSRVLAQLELSKNYGFQIGFIGSFGTHVQRFGIHAQGYYVTNFAQFNAGIRLYDNFKNLGPIGEHAEMNAFAGICIGYGKSTTEPNVFLSAVSNQTGLQHSFAYSYNYWFNKNGTTQVTGIIAIQVKQFSIISENDIFAWPLLDRFRTGAILLQYQDKNFQYAINTTMWTGQMGEAITNDSLFPYRGYINTVGGKFPFISHGLLSAQVKWANEYGQYLQANVGIDAEQVRNAIQNKAAHSIFTNNLFIPMIDRDGKQYLYQPQQLIKKAKPYINVSCNPQLFY